MKRFLRVDQCRKFLEEFWLDAIDGLMSASSFSPNGVLCLISFQSKK